MPKLTRVSGETAIRALARMGFEQVRQRGSHVVLRKSAPVADSELKFSRKALLLKAIYGTERLQLKVERCNIFGSVEYWVDLFAKIEVTGCHFPNGVKLISRRKEGEVVSKPEAKEILVGVGAGAAVTASGGSSTGGSIWAEKAGSDDADRMVNIHNDEVGFSIKFPGDWKTANKGKLSTGPLKLARPSVAVHYIKEAVSPTAAVNRMIHALREKGAKAVKAGNFVKMPHEAGASMESQVSYDAGGFRWRKKYVSIASEGKLFVLVGTYREDKAIETGSVIASIMMSFRIK